MEGVFFPGCEPWGYSGEPPQTAEPVLPELFAPRPELGHDRDGTIDPPENGNAGAEKLRTEASSADG
jgi:hypothetical protein